jgi:hypothetical protein
VPGAAPDLADAVLNAATFGDSYEATMDILAEGGVATQFNALVKRPAKAPAATMFVFPVSAVDLAMEAADRETMATFTLDQFGQMVHELGWPTPEGVSPGQHWVDLLAAWYAAAAAAPEAPDSFAVLFIAAMNQKQLPPANIATGLEAPSSIRLSSLEIELLIAAFDRTRPMTAASQSDEPADPNLEAGSPCSDFVKQAGVLGQLVGIGAAEGTGNELGTALEQTLGKAGGEMAGNAFSALGTVAKIGKLIQQFRYGYVKLELKSPSPVKKPLRDQPNKVGDLTATAGVDPAKYDEMVAARGGAENSEQTQALADCYSFLGLPTPTDARDIAADAENWRVGWSIVQGGGTQVTWSAGQNWKIDSGMQMTMTRVSDTTVEDKVKFDILPQPTKATVGRERTRKAVFKVQLHRGGIPELSTLWGSGKAGFVAAAANPIGVALGITDALTDITSKWILEGASPSAFVRQDLIEVEPTGLVGTISWTIQGSPPQREEHDDFHRELERALIDQTGYLEIVSEKDQESTAFGSETCKQTYGYGLEHLEVVEGSDVVGTRTSRTARQYDESWLTPFPKMRTSLATVIDGSTAFEGIDISQLPPELRDMANRVTIFLDVASLSCGPLEGHLDDAMIEFNYLNGWKETDSYDRSPITIVPSLLMATTLELKRPLGSNVLVGQSETKSTRMVYGVSVPLVQKIRWDLHWVQ